MSKVEQCIEMATNEVELAIIARRVETGRDELSDPVLHRLDRMHLKLCELQQSME